jgi:hypothetical protein
VHQDCNNRARGRSSIEVVTKKYIHSKALRFECFQRNLCDNIFYHSSQCSHGIAYYFIISLRVEVSLFVLSPEIEDRNAVGRAAVPLMQILFFKESNYLNPPPPGGTAILPEYIHYYRYYYQVIVQCYSS